LGDTAFWAGVKDYLTTFAGRVVETDDFRKSLERHTGTNLTKFFDQWYARAPTSAC
jgi:aminopeptidase N